MADRSTYKRQHLLGQAGVLRVASELMFRGLHVMFPAVDVGVDLFVEGGTRIQVKTTRLVGANNRSSFRITPGYRVEKSGKVQLRDRNFSETCDFVVLFNATLGKFWIVPAHLLDGLKACGVGDKSRSAMLSGEQVADVRARRALGESWNSIAESFGVSVGLVRQIMKSPLYGKSTSVQISEHEGDWKLIESHASLMSGETQTISLEVCHSLQL